MKCEFCGFNDKGKEEGIKHYTSNSTGLKFIACIKCIRMIDNKINRLLNECHSHITSLIFSLMKKEGKNR